MLRSEINQKDTALRSKNSEGEKVGAKANVLGDEKKELVGVLKRKEIEIGQLQRKVLQLERGETPKEP